MVNLPPRSSLSVDIPSSPEIGYRGIMLVVRFRAAVSADCILLEESFRRLPDLPMWFRPAWL
jgi:hypothetical protein